MNVSWCLTVREKNLLGSEGCTRAQHQRRRNRVLRMAKAVSGSAGEERTERMQDPAPHQVACVSLCISLLSCQTNLNNSGVFWLPAVDTYLVS